MRIALVANTSWYIYNFRLPLIKSLVDSGHIVYVFAPADVYSRKLAKEGSKFINWELNQTSTNVVNELFSLFRLNKILNYSKIDLAFSYTPKGNIYTSISCLINRKMIVNNISGLGVLVTKKSILSSIINYMYSFLLRFSMMVFFQNDDDRRQILDVFGKNKIESDTLPGSGVDLNKFSNIFPKSNSEYDFLLSARLLKEKGVYEYVDAAKILLKKYPKTSFAIAGQVESGNGSAVKHEEIATWTRDGIVSYLGFTDHIKSILKDTKCFVLPSYYGEGVPRGLLEAASMSIPLITTDHPGCRDAVDDGHSGYLCRAKDSTHLAKMMIKIIEMSPAQRIRMGNRGRKKMEQEFDEKIVIDKYLKLVSKISSE